MEEDFASILRASSQDGMPPEDFLPLVYDELRSLAAARMRGEEAGHTLQATALVHDAWMRISKSPRTWNDRTHFFRSAALEMRRILVESARKKATRKRGSNAERVALEEIEQMPGESDDRLLLVDEMLTRLEKDDPESARIINLKFFGGLTNKEIAEVEGLADRTVDRRWAFARTRLFQMMSAEL